MSEDELTFLKPSSVKVRADDLLEAQAQDFQKRTVHETIFLLLIFSLNTKGLSLGKREQAAFGKRLCRWQPRYQ